MSKKNADLYTGTPFEGMAPEQVRELSDRVQANVQKALDHMSPLCDLCAVEDQNEPAIIETTDPATIPTAAAIEYTPHFVLSQEFGTRKRYTMTDPRDNELIIVDASACDRGETVCMWEKQGYILETLPTYWHVDVYAKTPEGEYFWYNPTIKQREGGAGMEINFDWIKEATAANLCAILAEIRRRYVAGEKITPHNS